MPFLNLHNYSLSSLLRSSCPHFTLLEPLQFPRSDLSPFSTKTLLSSHFQLLYNYSTLPSPDIRSRAKAVRGLFKDSKIIDSKVVASTQTCSTDEDMENPSKLSIANIRQLSML